MKEREERRIRDDYRTEKWKVLERTMRKMTKEDNV
jgi:hypothetical protein